MIRLDTNKEKKLEFTISLVGRFSGEMESHFRIYFDNYQIGFPAKVSNFEKVIVKLPKLSQFIQNFPEKARGSLEIIQDRDMYLAWQDTIEFKQTDIKATLDYGTDDDEEEKKEKVEIKASLKDDGESEEEVKKTPQKKSEPKKEAKKEESEEEIKTEPNIGSIFAEKLKESSKSMSVEVDHETIQRLANEKKTKIQQDKLAHRVKDAFKSAKD